MVLSVQSSFGNNVSRHLGHYSLPFDNENHVCCYRNKAFGFKCNFAIRLSSKKNTDNFFNSKDATNSVNFNSKP